MNEEQKARALALARIPAIAAEIQNRHPVGVSIDATGPAWVPDLADETGAVEGVLHRVLEKLVGEPVEVQASGTAPEWRAHGVRASCSTWPTETRYPTRLDAIVAAMLALEPGR